jgi:murein DD-endopeptidase MepM/ murein hydrolase activator NlpD
MKWPHFRPAKSPGEHIIRPETAPLNEIVGALGPLAEALVRAITAKVAPRTVVRVAIDVYPSRAVAILVRPPGGDWIESGLWAGERTVEPGVATTYPGPEDGSPDLPTLVHPCPGGFVQGFFGPTTQAGEPAATFAGRSYAHFHNGLDFRADAGTPVFAAADGTVVDLKRDQLAIGHAPGWLTEYAHIEGISVTNGQIVHAGEQICTVGVVGDWPGHYLHFTLYAKADGETTRLQPVDPLPYLAAGSLPTQEGEQ